MPTMILSNGQIHYNPSSTDGMTLPSQVRVKSATEEVVDKNLPKAYDRLTFKQVCDRIYNLIFERASQGLAWGT